MRRASLLTALACAAILSPDAARAQIMVVGNSVREHEAVAGERYTGEIRLRNQGTAPQPVRVYQTDYLFYADGSNLYPAPGSHARSNGAWIEVTPTDLVIPGGQEMGVAYEVAVPADPGPAGTYWSMIMVEPTDPVVDDPEDPSRPAVALRTTVRFGMQIATHVRGEARHQLRLGNPRVTLDSGGTRQVEFALVNEGDVGYRPKVTLEVYDQAGVLKVTQEAQRGLIYPGTSALQRFELDNLPPGRYEAAVVVDTGALEIFGAQFTLNLDTGN